tara:strand:- start:347 stop:451 length:105 start_codon:yes stop_codon:yes gene_type:complete
MMPLIVALIGFLCDGEKIGCHPAAAERDGVLPLG